MTKGELPFCECGCGLRVTKPGNRFINGHNNRSEYCSQKTKDKQSERRIEYYKDQANCDKQSERRIEYYKDQANRDEMSKRMTEYWSNQDNRDKQSERMSEIIKNSDAHKAASEDMGGGDDLVTHHYIYDESDLSLNTVKMTRSDHTSLHRLLQKLGYIVPHINKNNEVIA